jgi:hypothetical protein
VSIEPANRNGSCASLVNAGAGSSIEARHARPITVSSGKATARSIEAPLAPSFTPTMAPLAS